MHPSKLALTASILILAATLLHSPAQTPPAQPSTPTLSIYTRVVEVDINVTGADGKPVHGLTQADFTVTQDGQPISPRSFREHRPEDPADLSAAAAAAKPALPPNTFTNGGAPETVRPLYVLLLDSLDTPVMTQSIVQKAMIDFVAKLPAGTRVAVFSLSSIGKLSVVQGFTSDPDLLKKAIKSHKFDLAIPPLEDAGQDSSNDNEAIQQNPNPSKASLLKPQQPVIDQNIECNHAADRAEYTFSAMMQIARYLSGMPGRKNIIWYTGAFPLRMKNKQGDYCYDEAQAIRTSNGMLEHSHAFVYPIDPRAMDAQAKYGPDSHLSRVQTVEHNVMEDIASETGGKAVYTTNDLTAAAEQVIEAGSNYYTIDYTPTNTVMDTRAHTIDVKVDKPGLTLLYRHGFHANPPNMTTTGQIVQKATALQSAMMPGTLQPSQVLFRIAATQAPAPDPTLPPGNNPADPKAMKPPFRHLTLIYTIDLNGIQFDAAADGTYHGQFEYGANIYDASSGQLVNSSTLAAKPALPPAAYQSMLANGAKLRQDIDLPAKGDYTLRIGVHDLTTDRVGALEIPASAITPSAVTPAAQP
jgi:VWFA-related protein